MRKNRNSWIYSFILMSTLFLLTYSCKKNDSDPVLSEDRIIFNPNLTYDSIVDIDGNTYKTIGIGTQTWMAENLKTTKYQDGSLIETTSPDTLDISGINSPKYQWVYKGYESNVDIYGRLYTGYAAVDSRNICPAGWHVPAYEEWTILTDFLGGTSVAGGKLKETGSTHWSKWPPNDTLNATNESGFTALPGGFRGGDYFKMLKYQGSWWSSSEGDFSLRFYYMHFASNEINTGQDFRYAGYSVRCIKDSIN